MHGVMSRYPAHISEGTDGLEESVALLGLLASRTQVKPTCIAYASILPDSHF